MLGKNFSRQRKNIFLIFPRKQFLTFHVNCLHWRHEIICMKCQSLFSGKIRNTSLVCHLLHLHRVVKVKYLNALTPYSADAKILISFDYQMMQKISVGWMANSVDPDQIAADKAVLSGSTMFVQAYPSNIETRYITPNIQTDMADKQCGFESYWRQNSSSLYGASLHRAFHYHPSIVSIWHK